MFRDYNSQDLTRQISQADKLIRAGKYDEAYTVLTDLGIEIDNSKLNERDMNRYDEASIKRLNRIASASHSDKELKKYALLSAEHIRGAIRRRSRGVENKTLGFVSLAGIIIGLAFFLPNITGNAISNFSFGGSNFIWLGVFILGLIGSFFFLKQ